MKKKLMSKFKRRGLIFYIIIFLLIAYILFIDDSSFFQRFKYRMDLKRLQSEIENLEKDNARLEKENEDLKKNPKTWEKHARDMGMQKDNEETFIFKEEDK